MRAYFTMSDQRVYQLSLDRKTGEIQVQPKVKTGSEFVEKRLDAIIEQQSQAKYLTIVLILSILLAFVVVSIAVQSTGFCVGLTCLAIALIAGYIVVNYIEHLNLRYIIDTIGNLVTNQRDNSRDNLQEPDLVDINEKKNKNI